jgi:hypothetical protein
MMRYNNARASDSGEPHETLRGEPLSIYLEVTSHGMYTA